MSGKTIERPFHKELEMIFKIIWIAFLSILSLYIIIILFIVSVCWVTGLPPAHLLPGMETYDKWGIE